MSKILTKLIDQPDQVKACLMKFIPKPQGFIIFSGKNGTGKSYASSCALEDYRNIFNPDTDDSILITQSDLNTEFSKAFADWGTALHLQERICKAKFLVLDDLGTRTPSDAFMDFLYAIADKRYSNKLQVGTVITTNLNSKDLRERFGDHFVSRVASGQCFRFEGEDRRFSQF